VVFAVEQEDVEYTRPGGTPLLARVYRPRDAGPGALPALVDVHGGAWSRFDRTTDAYFDLALAADGMVVVALDFRQAPVRYPVAVADVVAGIRWVKAHAVDLGARADDVGLIGGSSGGHLLMLAALRPRAPEYATTDVPGAGAVDATVAYALPLWPILDPPGRYRYLLERRAHPTPARDLRFHLQSLIEGHEAFFGDQATMERASALRIVEAGEAERLPPIWIAHPELDENVTLEMTERFVAAYRCAGGLAELVVFPGVGHAFANFPGADADRCIAQMREFIRSRIVTRRGLP
jgi:acetyl esterase